MVRVCFLFRIIHIKLSSKDCPVQTGNFDSYPCAVWV